MRSSATQCRLVLGLGIGLALGVVSAGAGPATAEPGRVNPLRYGDCVSEEAIANGGQGVKAYTDRTAPYQGVIRGGNPPGLADENGEACRDVSNPDD